MKKMSYEGLLYNINEGLYTDIGAESTGYTVQIVISDAFFISTDDGYEADQNRIGHVLGLDLSSSDPEALIIGEYTISSNPTAGQSTFTADWPVDKTGNRQVEDS